MGLYKTFVEEFFPALSTANSVTVVANDVTLGDPANIAGTSLGDTVGCNTQIRLAATDVGNWSGKTAAYYNRRNLQDLKILLGGTIRISPVKTIAEAIPVINQRYGLGFTSDDLADGTVTLDANGAGSITLTAKATSKEWRGSVTFAVVKGDYSLALQIQNNVLNGLKYPDGTMGSATPSKLIAEAYSYPLDLSTSYSTLRSVAAGVLNAGSVLTAVVAALNTAENRTIWVADATASWGLLGAEVTYNGVNSSELTTNPNYSYVMFLKIPATNTQFSGSLILHYNDPNAVV